MTHTTPRSIAELHRVWCHSGARARGGGTLLLPTSDFDNTFSLRRLDRATRIYPGYLGAGARLSEVGDALSSHVIGKLARSIAGPSLRGIATVGGNVVGRSPGCLNAFLIVSQTYVEHLTNEGTIAQVPFEDFLAVSGDSLALAFLYRAAASGPVMRLTQGGPGSQTLLTAVASNPQFTHFGLAYIDGCAAASLKAGHVVLNQVLGRRPETEYLDEVAHRIRRIQTQETTNHGKHWHGEHSLSGWHSDETGEI